MSFPKSEMEGDLHKQKQQAGKNHWTSHWKARWGRLGSFDLAVGSPCCKTKRMTGLCALSKSLSTAGNKTGFKKILFFINKVSSIRGKCSCSSEAGCSQAVEEYLLWHSKDSMCRSSEQEWGQTPQPHQFPKGPSQQALLRTRLWRYVLSTSYLPVACSQLCLQKGEKLCMEKRKSFWLLAPSCVLRLEWYFRPS